MSTETTWYIERFAWPPRGLGGIRRSHLLAKAMVHVGIDIGSRLHERIRNSRRSPYGARAASRATVYSIAESPRRS